MVQVIRFYKTPGLSTSGVTEKINTISKISSIPVKTLTAETCFYVETQDKLKDQEILQIRWVLGHVLNPVALTDVSKLPLRPDEKSLFIEIGPRYVLFYFFHFIL